LQAIHAVLLVQMDDDFCVGSGSEYVALFQQLAPKFQKVVNLAIKDDPDRLVLVADGLMAAFQVNDT